jgi:hypothetical protein
MTSGASGERVECFLVWHCHPSELVKPIAPTTALTTIFDGRRIQRFYLDMRIPAG